MTLHRLRLFVATAKHLSITEASRELRISQPAISYQLKLLQEQMGAQLFTRTHRGIELTDRGQIFVEEATSILSQIDALGEKHREISLPGHPPHLILGGSHCPSALLLPSLMTRFCTQHPSVELTLRTGTTSEIQRLIVASEVDIGVATDPVPWTLLVMEPLRKEKLTMFVPATHPLGKRRCIDPMELFKFSFIVQMGTKGRTKTEEILCKLAARKSKLKVLMRCDSPESVKVAVAKGAGVGVLYHDSIRNEISRGTFKTLKIEGVELSGRSYILYAKNKPLSPTAYTFLTFLRTAGIPFIRIER